MDLVVDENRIGPVRGLIITRDRRGKPFATIDLQRWIRLNRVVFKAQKLDLLLNAADLAQLPDLHATAAGLQVKLSVRIGADVPPDRFAAFEGLDLLDAFLCAEGEKPPALADQLAACRAMGLPIRLQWTPPFPPAEEVSDWANRLAEAGVTSLNLALGDAFSPARAGLEPETLERMCAFAEAIAARKTEINLIGLPFCQAPEGLVRYVVNSAQFHLDHQHYERGSYELARTLFRIGPVRAKKTLLILLARHTSYPNPIDTILLPWIIDHPWVRARIWAWHKLTRHLRLFCSRPKALDAAPESQEAAHESSVDAACRACPLFRICDGIGDRLRGLLPGIAPRPMEGAPQTWPLHFAAGAPKHYDEIDRARRETDAGQADLAARANKIVANEEPDREIEPFDYGTEGQWNKQQAGSVRWFSWTNTEKISTPMAYLEPPFTLTTTFGGGIAEYIGFSFGRHCKLVCPMEAYAHRLTLHVEEDGRYVLLRDGAPVRPVEFVGAHYVPVRLGSRLELRLSAWNIDGVIDTQGVYLWERPRRAPKPPSDIQFSFLIVSTRYARRLQATLLSIAHQRGFDLRKAEVVVAHVPGIDATGDLIENIEAAHPDLRIVRSPFPEHNTTSKGFLINESLRAASGEWVVLLDSDIVLGPDMLAAMEAAAGETSFMISDGRKMLSRETTAQILLGAVQPWEAWDELLQGPGEYRRAEADSVPIGFFQAVRRECFDTVRYIEMNHFEGADWQFGVDMRKHFGQEHRLSGFPVLHLDHGGSQWYGTVSHR